MKSENVSSRPEFIQQPSQRGLTADAAIEWAVSLQWSGCARSLAITALLLSVTVVARSQSESASPPLPPPGQLIDLGGWRLHLNCSGKATASQPTVITEAGAGDFSVDWSLVQPAVARFGEVCSYDRAGSGWSDLGPRPRTMHQQVWELHTLLAKEGLKPPFVLVGHS